MEVIAPEDYEAHMAAVGQAEANAHLIKDLIELHPLSKDSRLLVAGAGPGQMFDYVSPDFLLPHRVVFTDISAAFLDRLQARLAASSLRFEMVLDDVEVSRVRPVDAVALVLVLEHVDWRKALDSLIGLGARRFYLIVQVNPPGMTDAVAPNRVLPGTLASLPPTVKSHLIDPEELGALLGNHGFVMIDRIPVPVADGKTMLGLVFDLKSGLH